MDTQRVNAMTAETIFYQGHGGDWIPAYVARPQGPGPFPSVVVLHHMPGWDEWSHEVARKFAHHGYVAMLPNLHHREAPGAGPDEASAAVRQAGGQIDEQVVGDLDGACTFLRAQGYTNKRVGVIGFCSGGRATYLVACRLSHLNAAVDCWGGSVVVNDAAQLTPRRPVAPIDLTRDLCCPLLGIFGNEDQNPSPEDVNRTEEELKKWNKRHEFYRYDGAGHGFFAVDRPNYRQAQAVDGWQKVFAFLSRELSVDSGDVRAQNRTLVSAGA
jgi:carboxymethylenebutenolidase